MMPGLYKKKTTFQTVLIVKEQIAYKLFFNIIIQQNKIITF